MNINKIYIIQPTTWERNLAGICYNPYWIYVAFKKKNPDYQVELYENVTVRDLDNIFENKNDNDLFLVDLTSYPQIELCNIIFRDFRYKFNIRFIGYKPLIDELKLPFISNVELEIDILSGVFNYIFYSKNFKYLLLNDCDSHIKNKDNRTVVPLFLSVGCKRNCPFCYVSNPYYPYGTANLDNIKKMIDYCVEMNYNIHFSDENFYNNIHLDEILKYLENKNIKWICLTDTISLTRVIKKYGEEYLLKTGNFLNEVGLETIDENNLDKKQNFDLLLNSKLNIFWLTITFMPNETIKSLNKTGEFLSKYGYKKEELLRRVVTNSTMGGLGQFFQPYHGTDYFKDNDKYGIMYSQFPIRLWPSFVGYKFLNDIPIKKRIITESDKQWFDLYSVEKNVVEVYNKIDNQKSVSELALNNLEEIVILAQLAKLNIIGSKE